MSFLKKLFGARDPLERLRQCCERREWAAALHLAEETDWDSMEAGARDAAAALAREAGDRLAELNLAEGEDAAAIGHTIRAREHFQLALDQTRSASLRERIEQALDRLERGTVVSPPAVVDDSAAGSCGSDCGPSCGPMAEPDAASGPADLDEETRIELYLGTLPADLAERYAAAGPEFLRAWLEAQEGDPRQALALLDHIPEAERNALYFSERGVLRMRCEDLRGAEADVRNALKEDPGLFPAFETLAALLATAGRVKELEEQLQDAISQKRFVGFSWSRLAHLRAGRGDLAAALEAGNRALATGAVDMETLVLCARLLEREARFDETEALLTRLPAGGCGGGAHPLLAEFWLRRSKNLDRALESFKSSLRQERDNPRWLLRIAQVYLARGWKSEAAEQFDRLLSRPDLPEETRSEARASMAHLSKI